MVQPKFGHSEVATGGDVGGEFKLMEGWSKLVRYLHVGGVPPVPKAFQARKSLIVL
jgi:hypothetical protein